MVKDLVYSWYGKITPDQTFVEEVVKIIAHCTTQLESRLRKLDHESLILDEIPELVERHINCMSKLHRELDGRANNVHNSLPNQSPNSQYNVSVHRLTSHLPRP